MTPEFPLRIIFDDGECLVIDSPEDLMASIDTLDSSQTDAGVWIRDALDRTVTLTIRNGFVEILEAMPPKGE